MTGGGGFTLQTDRLEDEKEHKLFQDLNHLYKLL